MPKVITIRIVRSHHIIIEHDGKSLQSYNLIGEIDDSSVIIKGIELTLETLGYKLDLPNLYTDMDLMVANFYKS